MRVSRRRYLTVAASAAAAISISTTRSFGQLAAFPGALGSGANATGGRGGTVEVVSNLNSSGAGSFAAAVSAPNSIVVFTVGGYIDLDGEIAIAKNVTIEGQTAPGQGIGLMDGEISFSNSSNDIVRDIRIRQGTGSGVNTGKSGVEMDGGSNIILDHLSVQFGQWDTMDLTNSSNVTVQNSLLSDPIHQQFGIHGQSDNNMTYAYNVFANDHNRNPDVQNLGSAQFINNVVYNVQAGFTSGNSSATRQEDVVNNYFITGPSTTSNSNAAFYQVDSGDQMYASGNMEDSNRNGVLDGSSVSPSGATLESTPWFASTSTIPTFTAPSAYAYDTTYAGQSLSRDSLDSLDIGQVQSLGTTGGTTATGDYLYTSPSQSGLSNGGYGTITGGAAPTSSANDGIPDAWATTHGVATWAAAHGATTTNPAFAAVLDPLGYSQIEDYANSLADQFVSQTWTASSGNWTTPANWNSAIPGIFQHALIRGTGTADGSVTITTSGNLAESLSIGGNGLGAGEQLNVSAGALTVEDTIFVGDQNNGTLAITGGVVTASNVQLGNTVYDSNGNPTNYTGTLNLTGGTLVAGQLVLGAGTPGNWTTGANWTWSGGTLTPATAGLFVNAPANLGSGGAILNTAGATATLAGALSGSGSFTKNGAGLAILNAANTYTGGTTVNAGTLVAGVSGALPNAGVSINGGTLQLGATTGLAQMTSLSIAGNGVLDVNNNHFILSYGLSDPISTIAAYLKSGYNGGAWNGLGGIDTSAPLTVNGLQYGLGFADGNDGKVAGLPSGQIEVKYTLLGDANLDGFVNGEDFTILASNFNQSVTGWDQGDFNYDGSVNGEDFTLLAANFNQGASGAASAGDFAALDAFAEANGLSLPASNVPEPASLGFLLFGAVGILARRHRRE
jgi:autotransporter-associated beta strand protein